VVVYFPLTLTLSRQGREDKIYGSSPARGDKTKYTALLPSGERGQNIRLFSYQEQENMRPFSRNFSMV